MFGAGVATAAGVDRLAPERGRSFHLSRPVAGAVGTTLVWRASAMTRTVALTFDDGPDPRWTPAVLDILASQGAHATFFVVGERASAHPSLVRRAASEGHALGNHTWSHANLVSASPEAVRLELLRCHEAVVDITGEPPAGVRPPWGRIDPVGLAAVAEMGSEVVMWSNDIRAAEVERDVRTTLRDVGPGSIILSHDGGSTPSDALLAGLARFVARMTGEGWSLVTVPELLAKV